MPPLIDGEKCVRCGHCATICPMRVFVFRKGSDIPPDVRFGEECWHCILCELECPTTAIKVRLPLPMMMPHVNTSTLHKN